MSIKSTSWIVKILLVLLWDIYGLIRRLDYSNCFKRCNCFSISYIKIKMAVLTNSRFYFN